MTIYSSEEQITLGQSPVINTPMLWINKYIQDAIGTDAKIGIPFFPTTPSSLDDITSSWIVVNNENIPYRGVMCTYDRLIKMRRTPFPHIKCEQLLYYFYATEQGVTDNMIAVTETVYRLLDRGDESAEEVNRWSSGKTIDVNGTPVSNKFYFHDFKVYQLEETRDIIDFGTARTYGGNKIIIDYDYHQMPELTNNLS